MDRKKRRSFVSSRFHGLDVCDYRELMKVAFERQKKLDPKFSVRQFAKYLDINCMHMSQLLRFERGLSDKNLLRIARSIGLSMKASRVFRFLVKSQCGRSLAERTLAQQGLFQVWTPETASEFSRYLDKKPFDTYQGVIREAHQQNKINKIKSTRMRVKFLIKN